MNLTIDCFMGLARKGQTNQAQDGQKRIEGKPINEAKEGERDR